MSESQNEFYTDDFVSDEVAGDSVLEENAVEETAETAETEEPEEKTEPSEPDENKNSPDDVLKQVEILRSDLQKITADRNRAWAELRKSQKPPEKKQDILTDEQLEAIIAEHGNDPRTMLRITKYIADNAARSAEDKAIDAIKISQSKKKYDQFVNENYSQLMDPSHPMYDQFENLKDELGLRGHPAENLLAGHSLIAFNAMKIAENSYQRGLKEGQAKKIESTRKTSLKENKVGGSTHQKKVVDDASPEDFDEVSDILGMNESQKKIYMKLRGAK